MSKLERISTQTLYPIAINQSQATIPILNHGGSIDKYATIVIPVVSADEGSFLPINIGIGSVIQSAQLLSNSGVVIAQNDNVGQWFAICHAHQSQEHNDKVERCRHGTFEVYEPASSGVADLTGNNQNNNLAGKINIKGLNWLQEEPSRNRNTNDHDDPITDANTAFNMPKFNNYRVKPDSVETARLYVSLQDLFPRVFNALHLPINLIKSEISLVLQFSQNGGSQGQNRRICASYPNKNGAVAPLNCRVLTDEVVMLCDYIIEENNSRLEQAMSSAEGLSLVYGDTLWNSFLLKGLPVDSTKAVKNYKRDIFQIGMSNEVLRQMFLSFQPVGEDYESGDQEDTSGFTGYRSCNPFKNVYCSQAITNFDDGSNIQVRVNSENLFNTPLNTAGQKIHELSQAYGASLRVPMATYDNLGAVIETQDKLVYPDALLGSKFLPKSQIPEASTIQGWNTTALIGSNNYLGINLQKDVLTPDGRLERRDGLRGAGRRITGVPIEIQLDRLVEAYAPYFNCNHGNGTNDRNLLVCSIVERILNIKDGMIMMIDG